MKKLFLAAALVFFGSQVADAATCFWNSLSASAAVAGTGGVCRLTITTGNGSANTTAGFPTGSTATVSGITGITGCNTTATVTNIDTTHIELQGTTLGGSGFGGTVIVAGGEFNPTNTANWDTANNGNTICAATGNIPKNAADTATFDTGANGGTVTLNAPSGGGALTITALTLSNFAGTFDNSVNNTTVTVSSGITNSSATSGRVIKLGSATYNFTSTGAANLINFGTGANLTVTPGTSTFNVNATTATTRAMIGGGYTYGNLTFANNSSLGVVNVTGNNTFANLTIGQGNAVTFPSGASGLTTTGTCALNGINTQPVRFGGGTPGTQLTWSTASACTGTWVGINDLAITGAGSFSATSSLNLGDNTTSGSFTISPPSSGGGGPPHFIGG